MLLAATCAQAADLGEHLPLQPSDEVMDTSVIELKPGVTRLVRPERPVQTAIISDPRIAEATILTMNVVAVTAKALGAVNLILLDESGSQISNTHVQVVAGADLRSGEFVPPRREVRVRGFGAAKDQDRTFLCANGCAPMPLARSQ